jgi:hypothetical protein
VNPRPGAKALQWLFSGVRFGSFPDIHEGLLTAISGRSDNRVCWQLPTDYLMRDQCVEPLVVTLV